MTQTTKKRRWFLLGAIFASLHTTFFLLITLLFALSGDPEAGMAYYIFYWIDYPLSRLLHFGSGLGMVLVGGGILWFLYGVTVQSLFRIRSLKSVLPFGIGILSIALFFLLPEIALVSMPDWEEHWERGTEARESDNLDLAIEHVAQAAQLAPEDEYLLNGIWDYLGRLYMERQDFDNAEQAFLNALKVVASRSESLPMDYLNCHNQLAWFYERVKKPEQQASHLHESIKYNRLVYEGDSTQEAGCWHSLAENAYTQGEIGEAFSMQNKAIEMEAHVQRGSDFSLNYMKEQLEEWRAEQSSGADSLKATPQE